MIDGEAFLDRAHLIRFINERKIGTRMLFASNYIRQPAFKNMLEAGWITDFSYPKGTSFGASDWIMNNTFWIACHPGLTKEMMIYMLDTIEEFAYEIQERRFR